MRESGSHTPSALKGAERRFILARKTCSRGGERSGKLETGEDRIGKERRGPDRIDPDRIEQDGLGQDRIG